MSGAKVLLIGGGGREHALAWALQLSPRVGEIVCAPGNGGIAGIARCVPVDTDDLQAMIAVVVKEEPALTVIGPEVPLALGIVDALTARGFRVFGPTRAAAELESSKAFSKRFMQRHTIPTAAYAVCSTAEEARTSLELFHGGVVVKANGLHAGKGVLICATRAEAETAIAGLFNGSLLGTPETEIVLEELLEGEEVSFLIMSDGKHVAPLLPAQDHKRIGEGDTGLNTGGMGVYTSDTILTPAMQEWILHHIAQPTIDGMAAESTPFQGVLFIGLMMTARGPMVLEYNTRFGDPETQAILLRLESDLFEAFEACVEGRLSDTEFRWRRGASVCVIAASGGYPGKYASGIPISGLSVAASLEEVEIFHAGTKLQDETFTTAGGRVLGACARAATLEQALARAYAAMAEIRFDGMYYRRDIGHRALRKAPTAPAE
ncbi:phosphoribosylamine--glycine ligase [Acidipila sp. EB88]|uniref:phosphoribosylamine--glycine ligase n=1 Tax=Acidipila sp. EB88 TaxID=2305226 RepID=UPI000F5FDD9C|nr:phosphoribosylamine--glycine ligase [Acidipila sp. EB88]RRA48044.1 phosphoribosylamine--glycine ligase [Acidipila sp. EB88]